MTNAKPEVSKRYHVGFNGALGKWVCTDYVGDTYGVGDTPMKAYHDCVLWLEMETSDIHK